MTKRLISTILLTLFCFSAAFGQKSSFIVLGDLHYDLLEDHDMEWLATKPDDLRQVTKEYTVFTANNWSDFTALLKAKSKSYLPKVRGVLQLGDLSEGLAGNPEKAMQMARNTMTAVDKIGMDVPVIITKGNHDITGPGAAEAFQNVYVPAFARFTGNPSVSSANYATEIDGNLFVCVDPWDKSVDMLDVLEQNLKNSGAKNKFVLIHEPVIPVNERCWHTLRNSPEKRERLLKILAQNRAVVLSAHLHLYSVVCRNTEWGPIVQIMVNSVVKDRNFQKPAQVLTRYGSVLATSNPSWQPETMAERIKWLDEETPHISYFKQMDLPGYGILTMDSKTGDISLEYYAAFAKAPYDSISISGLMK